MNWRGAIASKTEGASPKKSEVLAWRGHMGEELRLPVQPNWHLFISRQLIVINNFRGSSSEVVGAGVPDGLATKVGVPVKVLSVSSWKGTSDPA